MQVLSLTGVAHNSHSHRGIHAHFNENSYYVIKATVILSECIYLPFFLASMTSGGA